MEKDLRLVIIVVVLIAVGLAVVRVALPVIMVNQLVEKYTGEPSLSCAINTNYIVSSCVVDGSTMRLEVTNKGYELIYGFSVVFDGILEKMEFGQDKVTTEPEVTQGSPLSRDSKTTLTVDISEGPDFSNPYNIRVLNEACKAVSSRTSTCEIY